MTQAESGSELFLRFPRCLGDGLDGPFLQVDAAVGKLSVSLSHGASVGLHLPGEAGPELSWPQCHLRGADAVMVLHPAPAKARLGDRAHQLFCVGAGRPAPCPGSERPEPRASAPAPV